MVNLFSFIQGTDVFRKLEVSELLFVEYTCMQEATKFGIWSDSNYLAFITSGKKMWRTIQQDYVVEKGDILFIKKGANLTHQFFDDEFCAIFFFVPDDFIKSFMKRNANLLPQKQVDTSTQDAVIRVQQDQLLYSYCDSVINYLSLPELPSTELLMLKFDELLLSLCTKKGHKNISDYFASLCQSEDYMLQRVMEENYAYNLKIEDFAQLCSMSLSKFKLKFNKRFGTTPAAWLKDKKLTLAHHMLKTTEAPVNQVAFECGFEAPSHFIRVFKQKFGQTPLQYRQQHSNVTV